MDPNYFVLLYSKYSPECRQMLDAYERVRRDLPHIRTLCVDNRAVRTQFIKDIQLQTVPAILIVNPDNSNQVVEGNKAIDWFMKQCAAVAPPAVATPQQPPNAALRQPVAPASVAQQPVAHVMQPLAIQGQHGPMAIAQQQQQAPMAQSSVVPSQAPMAQQHAQQVPQQVPISEQPIRLSKRDDAVRRAQEMQRAREQEPVIAPMAPLGMPGNVTPQAAPLTFASERDRVDQQMKMMGPPPPQTPMVTEPPVRNQATMSAAQMMAKQREADMSAAQRPFQRPMEL